jgi:anaerobic dimethyl sulfoxide reductase subunit A
MKSVPVFCGKDCGGNACPLLLDVEEGRGLHLSANPAGGHFIKPCRRGFNLLKEHYAEDRLTVPLIRTGPRGSGSFREAGWDEALSLVAARLAEVRARHGAHSVLCLSSSGCTGALHGTQALTQRFLNVTGGCTVCTGNYSWGAALSVLPFLLGSRWNQAGADAGTMTSASMIVLWGANILDTRMGAEMPGRLMEAKKRAIPIIVIDPRRTSTVKRAATQWIPIRPGTDAAMMLAILHVLLSEGLVDRARARALATGFDALARSVLGQDGSGAKSPQWAEPICGVLAAEISGLARAWAAARPTMLIPGFSIQRAAGGEETFRLTVALQVATGNFGVKGGSTGAINNHLPSPRVSTLSSLSPAGKQGIPVLRWPDAVLEGRRGGYTPGIRAAYLAGSNSVNQGGDVNKAIRAFDALDFVVCNDVFLTPTAQRADVVLPAASALEKEDIGVPWLGNYLLYRPAALPPVGSSRSDYDIFCELAACMGAGEEFSAGRSASQWIDAFLDASEIPDREEFKQTGIYLGREQERVGLADFAADPAAHPLDTPSGKVEIECERYARETGLPALPGWRGAPGDERYSLALLTPKCAEYTHSQLANRSSPNGPADHSLWMHPRDAAQRGIAPGGAAKIFNQYGVARVRVTVTEDIVPGVVSLHEGVWIEMGGDGVERAGSANILTGTGGTGSDLAAVMHGVPVEVAAAEGGD